MNQNEIKVVFDKKDQYDRILPYLLPNEILFCVYDCKGVGTGFVGVTDKRLIYYDQDMAGIVKHKKMVSLPYNQIVTVMAADDGVFFKTSRIFVTTTGQAVADFEFRGPEKALWVYKFITGQMLNLPIIPTS